MPRPSRRRPGVLLLVALALPGVRVAHDGRSSPDAPDLHAVLVDADALLIGEVVVVNIFTTELFGNVEANDSMLKSRISSSFFKEFLLF